MEKLEPSCAEVLRFGNSSEFFLFQNAPGLRLVVRGSSSCLLDVLFVTYPAGGSDDAWADSEDLTEEDPVLRSV